MALHPLLVPLLLAVAAAATADDCQRPAAERYEPRTFLGYACADDCRRHKAGFAWAERRGLTGSGACAGLPPAEAEGCRAFAEGVLTAEQAGHRWALENEIAAACLCGGAGARFRAGCLQALCPAACAAVPAAPVLRHPAIREVAPPVRGARPPSRHRAAALRRP